MSSTTGQANEDTELVGFRAPVEEKVLVRRYAVAQGRSLSSLVREKGWEDAVEIARLWSRIPENLERGMV